jgi:hypothetical protein
MAMEPTPAAGQIAIMHRELIERRRWIGEERFLHAFNYCMLLPGPEAQQLAVYIGWLRHRTIGGIVAGAFFVIPSIFVLVGLSYVYAAYGHVPAVQGVLSGLPACDSGPTRSPSPPSQRSPPPARRSTTSRLSCSRAALSAS